MTATLAHGANRWQADEPRYGLFYKYNDRAATYHYQRDRIPGPETMAKLTDAQRAFFNSAWEAFGPETRCQTTRNDASARSTCRTA